MAAGHAGQPAPRTASFPAMPRRDALDLARELLLAGERVELHVLCRRLGIGRTTLYRWVGDRDRLLGDVLAELTDIAWDAVIPQAEGPDGEARAMDAGRRFMQLTATFPPLRRFAEREPQLALRILLDQDGAVATRIRAGFTRAFAVHAPDVVLDEELIAIAVQAGTAMEWAPVAIGREPELARASVLILSLFRQAAQDARRPQASRSNLATEQ